VIVVEGAGETPGLVPTTVTSYVPAGSVTSRRVRVDDWAPAPEIVTLAGLKLALAWAGRFRADRLTVPVNPLLGVMVTVLCARRRRNEAPVDEDTLDGVAVTAKPGAGVPFLASMSAAIRARVLMSASFVG
jgi:hypothetical protein